MGPPHALWQSVRQLAPTPASLPAISAHVRWTHCLSSLTQNAAAKQLASAHPASAACPTPAGALGLGIRSAIVANPSKHSVRSFASSSSSKAAAANTAAGGDSGGGNSSSSSNSGSKSGRRSESSGSETGQGWRQRMGLLLLVPGTVAGFLGSWQLKRRNEKLDMLEDRRAAMEAEPRLILESPDAVPAYTRVSVEGCYDHEHSLYIGPRARSVMGGTKGGHVLVTPIFNKLSGKSVLVNRGWVPTEWRSDPAMRALGQPAGQVAVDGVVRASENRGGFVPDNVGEQWYWIDVPAMAVACGLPPDTPLIELLTDTSQRPANPSTMDLLGGRTLAPATVPKYPSTKSKNELLEFSVMPDGHRNYAITWFTMSAFMLGLALHAMKLNRKPLRKMPSMAK